MPGQSVLACREPVVIHTMPLIAAAERCTGAVPSLALGVYPEGREGLDKRKQ